MTAGQSGYVDEAFAFTGRFFDQATGLSNNLHRWYDWSTGRWLSEDPIEFAAGDANLYRYVGNEPTMYVDPSGLHPPAGGYGGHGGYGGYGYPRDRDRGEYGGPPPRSYGGYGGRFAGPSPTGPSPLGPIAEVVGAIAGMFCEPWDYIMTGVEVAKDPWSPLSYAGFVPGVPAAVGKIGKKLGKHADDVVDLIKAGRAGKQKRLRELVFDPNVSSADRGWIQQEINSIERGQRTSIRVPPGKNLSHRRGCEAKKGFGYEHSDLQDTDLHKLQHEHEGY